MYKFTEEQIMIRDMVREFTKNEVAPYDKAMDETFSFNMEVYQQIYSKLVETGLMGIHIPEEAVRSLLTDVKEMAIREKRSLTDEEFLLLTQKYQG